MGVPSAAPPIISRRRARLCAKSLPESDSAPRFRRVKEGSISMRKIKGIRAGGLLFAATLAFSSNWALAQPRPKLNPLHIALANHSVSMTAIYVAKQLGIFESYGYDARVLVLEP